MGAGEVKASLDLGDGALHVGSRQGLGEAGEGQRHDEELRGAEERERGGGKGKFTLQV